MISDDSVGEMPLIVLASASPRRRELMEEAGYAFTVEVAGVEESAPEHLSGREVVMRNAWKKADAVAKRHPEALVIGVDTEVIFEGEVLGKPADWEGALAMIGRLNGKMHEVWSGVWLMHRGSGWERGFAERTGVYFRRLSVGGLRAYQRRIGPLDKAGGYGAQDDRGEMIERVEGSLSNVIGLPMERLGEAIKAFREGWRVGVRGGEG